MAIPGVDSRRLMQGVVRMAHSDGTVSFQPVHWVMGKDRNEMIAVRQAIEYVDQIRGQLKNYKDYLVDQALQKSEAPCPCQNSKE